MSAYVFSNPAPAWMNGHEVGLSSFTVEVEEIDVTPSQHVDPDPSWTFTDACGHFHAFGEDGTLPTLSRHIIDHADPEDPDESWTETIMKCAICKEVVEPRYKVTTVTWRETAPGRMSWEANVIIPNDVAFPGHAALVSFRARWQGSPEEIFGIGGAVSVVLSGRSGEHPERIMLVRGMGPLGKRKITDA